MNGLTPGTCRVCGCTETSPCRVDGGGGKVMSCGWVDDARTLCTALSCVAEASAELPANVAVMGGANIDAARISCWTAIGLLPKDPERLIIQSEVGREPTVQEALREALYWLYLARALQVEASGVTSTSLHIVGGS